MGNEMTKGLRDREYQKFISAGDTKTSVRVNDSSVASNQLAIAAETITLIAGAAGTNSVTSTDKAPIYDSDGTHVGDLGNTSFAFVTGTILTTEVAYRDDLTDAEQYALMSNGDFAIDYDTGKIRYQKATSATSDTANYTTRQLNIEVTGSSVTASNNIEQLGGIAINLGSGVVATGTQRVSVATDDILTVSATDAANLTGNRIWVTSDVDMIGGTAIVDNGGNRAAGVQTMTLADDDPAVASLGIMDDWDNAASDGASVSGDVAHNGVDAGEPVKIGGYAASSAPTAVAVADRVNAWFDLSGRQQVTAQGYDSGTDSVKVFEVSPVSDRYVSTEHAQAAAVAATYFIDMRGYSKLTLQFQTLTDASAIISMSCDPAENGDDAGDYVDVNVLYTGAATVTSQKVVVIEALAAKFIKVVTTDLGAMAFTLYSTKAY